MITFITLLFMVIACGKADDELNEPKEITIDELYPGSILNVDKIELVDGSSGNRKSVDFKKEIESFLYDIKDIRLQSEKNQEGAVGYIFRIILYEENVVKMDFTPNNIEGIYYETNEDLYNKIKRIFEKHFERGL